MEVDPPQCVRISSPNHRVEVVAEDRADVLIDGRAETTREGSQLSIGNVSGRLRVRVPNGTNLQIGTHPARVEVRGRVGSAAISTNSGRVAVGDADSVDIRTDSGAVEVGAVLGDVRVRSSSGRVEIRQCIDADVSTESGRIDVRSASGDVSAHCVSGRIEVDMSSTGDVIAETVTGRIDIGLADGAHPYQPTVDDGHATRPDDCDCTVIARSVTGRVAVSSR